MIFREVRDIYRENHTNTYTACKNAEFLNRCLFGEPYESDQHAVSTKRNVF